MKGRGTIHGGVCFKHSSSRPRNSSEKNVPSDKPKRITIILSDRVRCMVTSAIGSDLIRDGIIRETSTINLFVAQIGLGDFFQKVREILIKRG